MEGKFQTSFIPKTNFGPTPPPKRRGTNLPTVVSLLVFIVAIALAAGAFAYTLYLNNHVGVADANLKSQLAQLSTPTVTQMSQTDRRMQAVKSLLAGHVASSEIFTFLADNTLANVRFSDFSYIETGNNGVVDALSLKGQAASFADVALQAQQFSSPASQAYIKNPVFSNLGLDTFGNVTFNFTATIIPSAFTYGQGITATTSPVQAASTTPTT